MNTADNIGMTPIRANEAYTMKQAMKILRMGVPGLNQIRDDGLVVCRIPSGRIWILGSDLIAYLRAHQIDQRPPRKKRKKKPTS
jgi:hypothetical protein